MYIEADIIKMIYLYYYLLSMKTAGILLDFKNDSWRILGRYTNLQSMTYGHYSFPLTNMLLEVERPTNVVLH